MSIKTKDYWTMVALEVAGYVPAEILAEEPEKGRNCVITYAFPDEASEDYDRWMRGAIGPKPKEGEEQNNLYEIVRKIQQINNKFKNNLHRYHIR